MHILCFDVLGQATIFEKKKESFCVRRDNGKLQR